jgi:hypothetical protein
MLEWQISMATPDNPTRAVNYIINILPYGVDINYSCPVCKTCITIHIASLDMAIITALGMKQLLQTYRDCITCGTISVISRKYYNDIIKVLNAARHH